MYFPAYLWGSINLIPKLESVITKITQIYVKIDPKIVIPNLANSIQACIRKVRHHNQVKFTLGMQGWFNAVIDHYNLLY